MNSLPKKELPKALPITKLIGPSFILLGLGLGSGELILWPYLTAHYGLGIIWGAVLGISFQFIMNMEIERYALAHGESIFVGFWRKSKWLPIWFLLSTFLPWIWPGIAASSATLLGSLFGITNTVPLTIGILITIGLILSTGPVLYKTQENLQKTITLIGVPSIFLLTFILAKQPHWEALANGIIGNGDGFRFLPTGIPIATFLGALAYAGAGGNLNLAQSYYVREKGYGMGAYAEKIRGLLYGTKKDFSVKGNRFEITKTSLERFNTWWRNINIEHFIVFWLTGALTIVMLGLLSYITVYNKSNTTEGINFLFVEAKALGGLLYPFVGTFFIMVAGITLFGTQLGVFDATSRILSENIVLASQGKIKDNKIPVFYYGVLWTQIATSIVILLNGFTQPLQLVIIAAVLNAFAMFVHVGLTLWTNKTLLAKEIRPNIFRTLAMATAFLFYGGFSIYIIIDKLFNN